jgi:ATP-dependent protease Clp ATPase subunit
VARADLLRRLFFGYQNNDKDAFLGAAREIVDEERKKSHLLLANELSRILEGGRPLAADTLPALLEAPPKDSARQAPLFDVQWSGTFLDDLVLGTETRRTVLDVLDQFRQWDVLEAHALTPPHKLLFCGPPGCGKTVTARAAAAELGLPLVYVRFDAVVSSLLGETAANLRKVFDYCRRGSWVLLFDEFDAIGRSRDDATEHGELKRVVNTFPSFSTGSMDHRSSSPPRTSRDHLIPRSGADSTR